jgi:hypothetical protein
MTALDRSVRRSFTLDELLILQEQDPIQRKFSVASGLPYTRITMV